MDSIAIYSCLYTSKSPAISDFNAGSRKKYGMEEAKHSGDPHSGRLIRYSTHFFILPKRTCARLLTRSEDFFYGIVRLGSLTDKMLGRSLPPKRGRKGVLASREFIIGVRRLLPPDICRTLPLTHIPSIWAYLINSDLLKGRKKGAVYIHG